MHAHTFDWPAAVSRPRAWRERRRVLFPCRVGRVRASLWCALALLLPCLSLRDAAVLLARLPCAAATASHTYWPVQNCAVPGHFATLINATAWATAVSLTAKTEPSRPTLPDQLPVYPIIRPPCRWDSACVLAVILDMAKLCSRQILSLARRRSSSPPCTCDFGVRLN
jgi:hypothetical protein